MAVDPIILVHGGAWSIPDDAVEDHLRGVNAAVSAGWKVLASSGKALDAVEEAVAVMEDDETFDAGRGSFLNSDGVVQMDALIMDGATLGAGGIGCVERIRNPIRAARKVLCESSHSYLVGEGAERFAADHGIRLCAREELVIERELERLNNYQSRRDRKTTDFFAPVLSHDTVGAVALDAEGNLVAANSTGGTLGKTPGRVGDSSLIGCGCYADNQSAAACATGWGEPIMRLVLAKWACDRIASGLPPDKVALAAIQYLRHRLNGYGGMIVLDRTGKIGISHNTPRMAWALKSPSRENVGIEFPSVQT